MIGTRFAVHILARRPKTATSEAVYMTAPRAPRANNANAPLAKRRPSIHDGNGTMEGHAARGLIASSLLPSARFCARKSQSICNRRKKPSLIRK